MSTSFESLLLLDRVGVDVVPAKGMKQRYVYASQARTLFVDWHMFMEELCAVADDVLAEVMQAWEPISGAPPAV